MTVLFDANILIELLSPKTPVDRRDRLEYLVEQLQKDKIAIVVPAPSLTELLAKAGKAREAYLATLDANKTIRIAPFGKRAALECAMAMEKSIAAGDKRGGAKSTWAKAKFDRQIVAIAEVEGAKIIYSDDGDILKYCRPYGIEVRITADLPLPPHAAQGKLMFDLGEQPRV
ncbi:MAG: PIN domain-containing protein [Burkholderiales bacterium]